MTGTDQSIRQLPLDLEWPRAMSRADWISTPSNERAFALVDGQMSSSAHAVAVYGPEGSGKTHLAAIWAERARATRLDLGSFQEGDVRAIAELGSLVIEDLDRFLSSIANRGDFERAMNHLFNVSAEEGRQLLFTGRSAPARWTIELPDLASRLSAMPAFAIEAPDDTLLHALILKLFEERGLLVDDGVVTFMTRRTVRGYRSLVEAVETLDAANLETSRSITVPFVKDVLGW